MKKQGAYLFALLLLITMVSLAWHRQHEHHAAASDIEEYSPEEYSRVRNQFLELAKMSGTRAALARVRVRVSQDDAFARSCHPLVHELGRSAYLIYDDFAAAMEQADEICNSAYLHGVIEAHFSESSDVISDMQGLCANYPHGTFKSWECHHGIGHGLMYYTSNDLPQSLALCDDYKESFSLGSCVNGVFMEQFNTDQKTNTVSSTDLNNPLATCAQQNFKHKADCYLYAPTHYLELHVNNYKEALDWCTKADPYFIDKCVQGVGSQIMKEHVNDPLFTEKQCDGTDHRTSCIEGAIATLINHHGSLEQARALCGRLAKKNRLACETAIRSSAPLFQ